MAALIPAFLGVWAVPLVAQEYPDAVEIRSRHGIVAADHSLASQLGADVLSGGGNAADAAVTALLAVGLANPSASGMGGGGFCLYRAAATGKTDVIDFRETAPAAATRDMFVVDGKVSIEHTKFSGDAIGTPGEVAGLSALHERHGSLPWSALVAPVRETAERGVPAGRLLVQRITEVQDQLAARPAAAALYQTGGTWVKAGQVVKSPGLAKLLRLIEDKGRAGFYEGDVPEAVARAVAAAGGRLSADDVRSYQVAWREPLVGTYRDVEVLTMPPPSSGGTTLLAALNVLEHYDLRTLGRNAESLHRVAEALKHAFADRARWLGDTDFVDVPVTKLVSKEYAAELRRKIRPDRTLPFQAYGTEQPPPDDHGTSHVSIMDRAGNMASCTSTINTRFGSMIVVPEYGLLLNNQMADFTSRPGVPNNYGLMGNAQNAIAPRKRPLSSMSPTLVVREGQPLLALGGSGGPTIISGTLLTLLRILDWQRTPGQAVDLPRLHHQWLPDRVLLEPGQRRVAAVLRRRGHEVFESQETMPSGSTYLLDFTAVELVFREAGGTLVGVSEPRHFSVAAAAKRRSAGPNRLLAPE